MSSCGGGGVDLDCVRTSDTAPPSPLSYVSQPQRPDLQQTRCLERVFPQVRWSEMVGNMCVIEEMGIMIMYFAKWAEWVGLYVWGSIL